MSSRRQSKRDYRHEADDDRAVELCGTVLSPCPGDVVVHCAHFYDVTLLHAYRLPPHRAFFEAPNGVRGLADWLYACDVCAADGPDAVQVHGHGEWLIDLLPSLAQVLLLLLISFRSRTLNFDLGL